MTEYTCTVTNRSGKNWTVDGEPLLPNAAIIIPILSNIIITSSSGAYSVCADQLREYAGRDARDDSMPHANPTETIDLELTDGLSNGFGNDVNYTGISALILSLDEQIAYFWPSDDRAIEHPFSNWCTGVANMPAETQQKKWSPVVVVQDGSDTYYWYILVVVIIFAIILSVIGVVIYKNKKSNNVK